MAFFGRQTSIEPVWKKSETAEMSDQHKVQSLRVKKFRNFVPWQVHHRALIFSTLAILPLISSFSIGEIFKPQCLTPLAFWLLNLALTLQVNFGTIVVY